MPAGIAACFSRVELANPFVVGFLHHDLGSLSLAQQGNGGINIMSYKAILEVSAMIIVLDMFVYK